MEMCKFDSIDWLKEYKYDHGPSYIVHDNLKKKPIQIGFINKNT